MKDIPVFTSEYGAASLILKEIPYQGTAYVIIRDSLEPEMLIEECRSFCAVCGADRVFATGHAALEKWPFYTAMWRLKCAVRTISDTDASLLPVRDDTMEIWRGIYNEKVKRVPNGAWMTEADGRKMLKKGDGYFIHRGQMLLGIGRAAGDIIDWVAASQPGGGAEVVAALTRVITGDTVSLTVASTNEKALRLYESLGFEKTEEISRWYAL